MTAKVIRAFSCRLSGLVYYEGDEYDGTPERIQELAEGGYVQSGLIAHEGKENGSDGRTDPAESISADMTVAQLREVAISRGVEVPKRVSKAKLLEMLGA